VRVEESAVTTTRRGIYSFKIPVIVGWIRPRLFEKVSVFKLRVIMAEIIGSGWSTGHENLTEGTLLSMDTSLLKSMRCLKRGRCARTAFCMLTMLTSTLAVRIFDRGRVGSLRRRRRSLTHAWYGHPQLHLVPPTLSRPGASHEFYD